MRPSTPCRELRLIIAPGDPAQVGLECVFQHIRVAIQHHHVELAPDQLVEPRFCAPARRLIRCNRASACSRRNHRAPRRHHAETQVGRKLRRAVQIHPVAVVGIAADGGRGPAGERAQPPQRLGLAGRKRHGGWQRRLIGDRQALQAFGHGRQAFGRRPELHRRRQRQRLPRPAERGKDRVRRTVGFADQIERLRSEAGCQAQRQLCGDGRIALAAVGPRVGLGTEYLRTRFGHQPRQLNRGIAAPDDQPAAAGAQVGIQRPQPAPEECHAFGADVGRRKQRGVQHEDRHDLRAVRQRRAQRIVVVQPQITAHPPDSCGHVRLPFLSTRINGNCAPL